MLAVIATVGFTVAATVPAPSALGAAPRAATDGRAGYERAIAEAVVAIQAFWRRAYPSLYGDRYVPVPDRSVIAAAPGVEIPRCQGTELTYRDARGNAFYCYEGNFVVYDDVDLFPELYEAFGPFSVALVLAHEWGHAVQDRAENDHRSTIHKELQADCFAGAWTRAQGPRRDGPQLEAGDLERSLAALLAFRDAPGTSPDDPSAHGSAFDRVSAFQEGFELGGERCAEYFDEPPLVVELPFSSDEEEASGGEVPADEVIPVTVSLLNEFYSQVEPAYVALTVDDIGSFDSSRRSTIPRCGGSRLTVTQVRNRAFYCIDDGYIAFDEPFLQQIYDEIGDFGVASLIANPWATHVQVLQGHENVGENELPTVLQADCYSGGWTAAIFNGFLTGGSLSPGDLDEFIEAFLVYSRARGISADVPITFLRVGYFRRGFFTGYQSCDLAAIRSEVADL